MHGWVQVILKTFPHYPLRLLVFPQLRQYDINSIEWWINLFTKEPNRSLVSSKSCWEQLVENGSTDVLSATFNFLLFSTAAAPLSLFGPYRLVMLYGSTMESSLFLFFVGFTVEVAASEVSTVMLVAGGNRSAFFVSYRRLAPSGSLLYSFLSSVGVNCMHVT